MSTLTSRSAAPWPKPKQKWTRLPRRHARRGRHRNRPRRLIQWSRRRTSHQGRQRPQPIRHRVCSLRSKTPNQRRRRAEKKGEKLHHDRHKSAVSQLHVQRGETSGPGSEDDAGRSKNHLQPPISRARHGRNHGARSLWRTIAIQLCESYWDEGVSLIVAGSTSANTHSLHTTLFPTD